MSIHWNFFRYRSFSLFTLPYSPCSRDIFPAAISSSRSPPRRYGANLANYQFLEQLNAEFPALSLLATEATLEAPGAQFIGSTPWKEAQKYAVDIIADLNQWTTGWIEWNVLLDSSGGPTCIGPSLTTFCTPLIGAQPRAHASLAPSDSRLLFCL
jgi:hypothetical protein